MIRALRRLRLSYRIWRRGRCYGTTSIYKFQVLHSFHCCLWYGHPGMHTDGEGIWWG